LAPKAGNQTSDLIKDLLDAPQAFNYFQAILLIYQSSRNDWKNIKELLYSGLKVRAHTALGFPASDLVEVTQIPTNFGQKAFALSDSLTEKKDYPPSYELTVTFMGLYGAASPLPPFYGQEILEDELSDLIGPRELYDLISYSSYRNHAAAYFYSQFALRLLEEDDPIARQIISALMGSPPHAASGMGPLGTISDDFNFLGLFSTAAKPALGLALYLGGKAQLKGLTIEECVPRWVTIPEEERAYLGRSGNTLGENCQLGSRGRDLEGKFRIHAVAKDTEELVSLMPQGAAYNRLLEGITSFLDCPLVADLKVTLAKGAAKPTILSSFGRLSLSAMLAPAQKSYSITRPLVN
jgi:type VI secretion system protein ImpH